MAVASVKKVMLVQGRNDAAVPGDSGTRFSLRDVIDSPKGAFRLEATTWLSGRSQLRAVLAPLSWEGSGQLNQPVNFQGAEFSADLPTTANYRFNSYRLTYRYAFVLGERWTFLGGLTGKLRHARIALSQEDLSEEKTDVGFVPLLHLASAYRFTPNLQAELELDGLVTPWGRAEDISLRMRYFFGGSGWNSSLGYRVLEGGADVDEVFTFSLFHYGVASVGLEF